MKASPAATLGDASRLFEVRRRSITELAPKGMSLAEAATWAQTLTVAGMRRKIRELEIWVAEVGERVVGWSAIRGDRLEGFTRTLNLPAVVSGPNCLAWSRA